MKNKIKYFSNRRRIFLSAAIFLMAVTFSYSLKTEKKAADQSEVILKQQAQEQHRQRQIAALVYLHRDSKIDRPLPSRFKNNPIFQIFYLLQRSS